METVVLKRAHVVLAVCAVLLALPLLAYADRGTRDTRDIRDSTHDTRDVRDQDTGTRDWRDMRDARDEREDAQSMTSIDERMCERTPSSEACDSTEPPAEDTGAVVINEVMFNPPGDDTGREWIEIYNGTNAAVNLSNWVLFENNSNHALTIKQGSAIIPAGGYAIIANNDEEFLADWPSFGGTVFDSAFSLSNTDSVALKNAADEIVDDVAWSSDTLGANDGFSHQRWGSTWVAAAPTPGTLNASTGSFVSTN